MHKSYKILSYLGVGLLAVSLLFSTCKKDDDDALSTSVQLLSFGPSPALRGGELKIIGKNLDKVTAVILPDNVNVTAFNSRTPELITLTVPEETVEGHLILQTPQGDITSISMLTISEPIVLTAFSPEAARPGEVLTIQGDYLNLIKTVIFSTDVKVGDTSFISQSREKIEVRIPDAAQTGLITLSDGEEMPVLVESEEALMVTVPRALQLSPIPVKAGTVLTIEGTDLDLTRQIGFAGTSAVSNFISQEAGKIEVIVPADAHDGKILLIPGSFLEVPSEQDLVMLVPEITGISPNPVKNGQNITVTGINLDLVKRVTFGGNKVGAILGGGTAGQITVKVPVSATEDVVIFETAAEKTVNSPVVLQLVKPVITGITPAAAAVGEEIAIEGTDLDFVTSVTFHGGISEPVNNALLTRVTVDVPIGALSGPLTVVTNNGTEVTSAMEFTLLLSTNAVITGMPDTAALGDMISITGENLDELSEVVFPGEAPATMFGQKTDTLIEVFVPMATATGVGNIKFITFSGEEFFSPPINIVQ